LKNGGIKVPQTDQLGGGGLQGTRKGEKSSSTKKNVEDKILKQADSRVRGF